MGVASWGSLLRVVFLGLGSSYAQWTVQIVDSSAGQYPCIQVDRFGYPHVGYSRNRTSNDVERYARRNGGI